MLLCTVLLIKRQCVGSDTNVFHEQISFIIRDWLALLTMRNLRLGFELLQ